MSYLAHSAREDCPAQSYKEHVENVCREAMENAEKMASFATFDAEPLMQSVEIAAYLHDMGKLNKDNQEALSQNKKYTKLPIHHQDAGVAFLKQQKGNTVFSQLAISSHHTGLPDICREMGRGEENYFRDQDVEVRKQVDKDLPELAEYYLQNKWIPLRQLDVSGVNCDASMFSRMMLSCLVDADHTDTGRHYRKFPQNQDMPLLKARERLKKLDHYVKKLGDESERSRLRTEMYHTCRDANRDGNIVSCDSPVGSAKTTALMAHALQQAISIKARHIFVVLPFTNIISQSVEVYRKALTLPGENPEEVVAELHHRADFKNEDTRVLSAQWKAPIIVTTAVAFFETMSSCMPSTIRRLHELPGSVIIVDEAHAALPVKLLPTAWHWMQILADKWSCYWILASGSLVKFWEMEEISEKSRKVPQIVDEELRGRLMKYETGRIKFCYKENPLSRNQLVKWVAASSGPRLLIMNTVQSAAVIARDLQSYYGNEQKNKVIHLSTALNAEDRKKIIDKVRHRLKNEEDTDWTLVATSCVEAGVDFSFKTGFREISSLLSLLQAAGRINRSGVDCEAEIWSFTMKDDDTMLMQNQGIKDAAYVLNRYFQKEKLIKPELSTRAIEDELKRGTVLEDAQHLLAEERVQQFREVNEKFRVIDECTVLVITDQDMKSKILYGECDWKEIQQKTVSVRKSWIKKLSLQQLDEGIYCWDFEYDGFLGIMKGYLSYIESN